MVEVCEGAPVAVSGWVLTDSRDLLQSRKVDWAEFFISRGLSLEVFFLEVFGQVSHN